jgi:hypothetical protein
VPQGCVLLSLLCLACSWFSPSITQTPQQSGRARIKKGIAKSRSVHQVFTRPALCCCWCEVDSAAERVFLLNPPVLFSARVISLKWDAHNKWKCSFSIARARTKQGLVRLLSRGLFILGRGARAIKQGVVVGNDEQAFYIIIHLQQLLLLAANNDCGLIIIIISLSAASLRAPQPLL